MHKQKKNKVSVGPLFGLLLFTASLLCASIGSFLPSKVAAKDIQDVLKIEWVSSNVIKVTATDSSASLTVGSDTYNVKDAAAGLYGLQSGVRDAGGQAQSVYVLSPQNKYKCQDAGKIVSKYDHPGSHNGNYMMVDDDTTRIRVISQTQVVVEIRFKESSKNQCLGPAGGAFTMDISQPAGSAGSAALGQWLDSANIQLNSGAPGIYKVSPSNSSQFISTATKGQGSCKDTVVITGPDDSLGTPVAFYDQKSGSGSPINKSCGLDIDSTAGYITNISAKTLPANSGLAATTDSTKPPPSCEDSFSGVINWLLCGMIEAIDSGVNGMQGVVDNLLSLDGTTIASNTQLYTLWSYFRNIASLLLVVVALVMIIGQSLGKS